MIKFSKEVILKVTIGWKLGILCYDNFFHIFQKIIFARNLLTNVDKSVDVHQQKKRIKK